MALAGVGGICSNGIRTIISFGLGVGSGSFVMFINPSKYNGAAALHVITNLSSVASNSLEVSSSVIGSMTPGSHGVTVIFRDCTLCPRVAMCSGVTFNLGLHGFKHSSVSEEIGGTTSVLKLGPCLSHHPGTLSNNRHRHITLNETVIHSTGMFLVSSPLSGLSTGLHMRVESSVVGVASELKVAAVCMARSRVSTVAVTSEVIIVGSNCVRRINAPGSVCSGPGGVFINKFVNAPPVGFVSNVIASSNCFSINSRGLNISELGIGSGDVGVLSSGRFVSGPVVVNVHPSSVRSAPSLFSGCGSSGIALGMSMTSLLNTSAGVCTVVGNRGIMTGISTEISVRVNSRVSLTFGVSGIRFFSPRASLEVGELWF